MKNKRNKVAAKKFQVTPPKNARGLCSIPSLNVIKNVRFSYDDLEKINKYAATLDRSASFVIRQAILEKVC